MCPRKIKKIEDIVRNTKIPQNTVYKKLEGLEEIVLIRVEKRDFSDHGHVTKFYKSRIEKRKSILKK